MRKNLIIALLSISATLLAVNLYVTLQRPQFPIAIGQGTGVPTGQVAIAAVQGSANEPWVYVYDVATQHLAVYTTKNQGIELKGSRQISWDLKVPDLPAALANRRASVTEIKRALEKDSGAGGEDKGK